MTFSSIISSEGLTFLNMLYCSLVSLCAGVVFGLVYKFTTKNASKSLIFSTILLPIAVQTVIMMVNGNIGAGVAVAGAFALVRFRSAPASAKEITWIFCAMAIGLATGMGFILFAGIMAIVFAIIYVVLSFMPACKEEEKVKKLKITVPEDLDYTTAFDDIFALYTKKCVLQKVKTTGLGSMYELTYEVLVSDLIEEKHMIDEIRLRNGNLTVVCTLKDVNANKEIF